MGSEQAARGRAARTAELVKQQEQERRRRAGMIGGLVAVLAVVAVVGGYFLLKSTEPVGKVKASDYGLTVGPDDAPVKLVIYEDFLCPSCGYLEDETHEKLQAAADAGKVQVDYRPFFWLSDYGDYSERAANAFRAVWVQQGDEAAKRFHDLLYAGRPQEDGPYPDDDWLVEQAVAAGADEAEIRPAIEGMDYQDWVDQATAEAKDLPIHGTPTVFIDGKFIDETTMEPLVEKVLAAIPE